VPSISVKQIDPRHGLAGFGGIAFRTTAAHLTHAADVTAIRRITISVSESLAEEIKKAAGDRPVWQWVQEVLEERLTDEELNRQWNEFYLDVNPGPEAIKQADEMFERLTMPTGRRGAA